MRIHRYAALVVAASILGTAACHSDKTGPNGSMTSFGGQATAAITTAPGAGMSASLAATGAVPSTGGAVAASLDSGGVTGLLDAESLEGSAIAQGSSSLSSSSATNVHLVLGTHVIIAAFVSTTAQAQCTGGNPQVTGSTEVVGLEIDGQPVNVTGTPGQTIALTGGGQLVIDEETSTPNSITVNGLHGTMSGGIDVIVAQSEASITCGTRCPPPVGDFVTGGGWVTVNGAKGTFGFEAGEANSATVGELEFNDHGSGLRVHSSSITGYTIVDATARTITGNTTVNGAAATFTLTVTDNGEPGRNDTFDLKLSTGYEASGTLGGGNIQLHPDAANCQ